MTLITVSTLAVPNENSVAQRHVLGKVSFEVRDYSWDEAPVAMTLTSYPWALASGAFKHLFDVRYHLVEGRLYEQLPSNPYEDVLGRLLLNGTGLTEAEENAFRKRSGDPVALLRAKGSTEVLPDPKTLRVDLSETERGRRIAALGASELICVNGQPFIPSLGPVFVVTDDRRDDVYWRGKLEGFWSSSSLALMDPRHRQGIFRYDRKNEVEQVVDRFKQKGRDVKIEKRGTIMMHGPVPDLLPDDLDIRAEAIAARMVRSLEAMTTADMDHDLLDRLVAVRDAMDVRLGPNWRQTGMDPTFRVPDIFSAFVPRQQDGLLESIGELIAAMREQAKPGSPAALALDVHEGLLSTSIDRERELIAALKI